MAFKEPVAVYNAASNADALMVRNALIAAGVEAFVIEDVSQIETSMGGFLSETHKPQVWVEKADVEQAEPVLAEYERRTRELDKTAAEGQTAGPPIEVVCEACGKPSRFPPSQRGSVQRCKNCGEFVDVGEVGEDMEEEWAQAETGEDESEPA